MRLNFKFGLVMTAIAALWLATDAKASGLSAAQKQKALAQAHYAEYTGKQRPWPVSTKALINIQQNKYGVPIYQDLPNKPYEVLGTLQTGGSKAVKIAAESAQAVGADAILVVSDKAFADAGIDIKAGESASGRSSAKIDLVQGILIRWKRE